MSKAKYKVTILKWKENQPGLKRGHPHFMLSKTFFQDNKIADLKQNECLFYINLLCIAGQMMEDSFQIHSKLMPNLLRIDDKSLANCLEKLRSNQLVSYEKIDSFIIEKNIKEEKIRENKLPTPQKPDEKNLEEKDQNKKIWFAYFNAYRLRYGIDPLRNASVNSQVSNLRKKLGVEEACRVVQFYLTHNDSWYVKNTHTFGLCLSNAETLYTQMNKGKAITGTMVKDFEKKVHSQERSEQIQNLWKEDEDVKL